MTSAIWWVRRDLRLHDNPALAAALEGGRSVVPAFILDPHFLEAPNVAPRRVAFLIGGLRALDEDLRARGSRLVVRAGAPAEVLAQLVSETHAAALYAEADFTPYALARDAAVAAALPLHLVHHPTVQPPDAVAKADGSPYVVFTPFLKRWRDLAPPGRGDVLPAPDRIPTPTEVASLDPRDMTSQAARARIPLRAGREEGPGVFPPGEAEARRRLAAFALGPIEAYAARRDRVDLDGTSGLSPYLRFGMLSAREAAVTALDSSAAGPATWLTELAWRDFYTAILYHFPHVANAAFRSEYDAVPWRHAPDDLAAWQNGRTGYPIVDAGMRQLAATGWMHNRARMIVASFLVKDLLVDWREGAAHFERNLVDHDPASNNGGWQWAAGTGTDAAPYFRVFNPVRQGAKFDPKGAYVRRWVPELAGLPDKHVHAPWEAPDAPLTGVRLGRDYPEPIVDHAKARARALAAYRAIL